MAIRFVVPIIASILAAGTLAAGLLSAAVALAQAKAPPAAAIVEDVDAKGKGAELLEYVDPGKRIDTTGGTIVLSYLASCMRETITGGVITVGEQESKVEGGKGQRDKMTCDGRLALNTEQASRAGVFVKRGANDGKGRA